MAREDRSAAKAAKAAAKAEAKANKKPGRIAQIRQIYSAARAVDPAITWWMIGFAVAVIAVFETIGLLIGHWRYFLVISLPFALLAAAVVMGRRAERAAYRQLEGQPGAAGAALSGLRRGWYFEKEPVAAEATRPGDFTSAALVFRAIGRPGVILVSEGPPARAARLVDSERKRVNRVAPNVPVHVLRIGDGEDEVPVRRLSKKISRMRPELTKPEVDAVNKRLKALGGVKMPVPKGMDPTRARPDRKAMRGR
jgi:Domain of unknown function (DUF4191)